MSVRSSQAKRWIKRCARRGLARASLRVGACRRGHLRCGLRILTYHRVAADARDPFAVAPRDFALQMEAVAATGAATGLDAALEEIAGGENGRPRIALTFDDGTRDFLTEALPVLSRLALPATLYVIPARVGEPGFLEWEELRAIRGAGIQIGSHGLDHRSLGRIPGEEVPAQVQESRRILEERLGCAVTSLAYPFGTIRDFNATVKQEVRRAGYRSACTSVNGLNRGSTDTLELRRTKIEQGDGPVFREIIAGGLDGWAFIDRHLAVLQNRYA
jgi:peptidoglycan/xylan/chitin deacetylase (PgdA/CDA1 family)